MGIVYAVHCLVNLIKTKGGIVINKSAMQRLAMFGIVILLSAFAVG
jgi:hypothetical protein